MAARGDEERVVPAPEEDAALLAKKAALVAAARKQDKAELEYVFSAAPEHVAHMLNSSTLHPSGIDLSRVGPDNPMHTVELLDKEAWGALYNSATLKSVDVRDGTTLTGQQFEEPFGLEQPGSVGIAINVMTGALLTFHDGPIKTTDMDLRPGGRIDKIEVGAVHEFSVAVLLAGELRHLHVMAKVVGVAILVAWGLNPDGTPTFTTGALVVIVAFLQSDGTTGYQVGLCPVPMSSRVLLTHPTPPYTTGGQSRMPSLR